jgi:hypothetical protein
MRINFSGASGVGQGGGERRTQVVLALPNVAQNQG